MQHRQPAVYAAMIDRRLMNLGLSLYASHRTRRDGSNSSDIGSSSSSSKSAFGVGPHGDDGNGAGSRNGHEEKRVRSDNEEGLREVGTRRASGGGGDESRGAKSSPRTGRGLVGSKAESLAQSCLALSVARQADLWPLLREICKRNTNTQEKRSEVVPVVYVAGELDSRYGGGCRGSTPAPSPNTVAGAIAAKFPDVRVAILPGCGHAVPTEAPRALFREVAKVSSAACAVSASDGGSAFSSCSSLSSASGSSGVPAAPSTAATKKEMYRGAKIVAFSLEEFSLQMTSSLQLSLCRLTERRGVLVRLEGEVPECSGAAAGGRQGGENGRRVWGVGEVTPLPGEKQTSCVFAF